MEVLKYLLMAIAPDAHRTHRDSMIDVVSEYPTTAV